MKPEGSSWNPAMWNREAPIYVGAFGPFGAPGACDRRGTWTGCGHLQTGAAAVGGGGRGEMGKTWVIFTQMGIFTIGKPYVGKWWFHGIFHDVWYIWLVVWNMTEIFSHIFGIVILDELIFFRGVGFNHQPARDSSDMTVPNGGCATFVSVMYL